MTSKKQIAYVALFRYIEKNICQLDPLSFMTDYETSSRNALRVVYPAVDLKGCYFHFTQAVQRKGANLQKSEQFFKKINETGDMNRLFHKFLALPLLPHTNIIEAFNNLKCVAATYGSTFTNFIKYFEQQWIIEVSIPLPFRLIYTSIYIYVYYICFFLIYFVLFFFVVYSIL